MSLDVGTEQNCSGSKISKEQKLYASLIVRASFGRLAQRVCHVLGLYGAVTFEELCQNVVESRDTVLPGDATQSNLGPGAGYQPSPGSATGKRLALVRGVPLSHKPMKD